jgi:hypothetical protein
MNYSEFSLDNYNIKPELLKLTSNDAQSILDDFEILTSNLESYKQRIEDLQANKIFFDNYISNLQNNHMNVLNIINNYNYVNKQDITESFLNYQLKIKEEYNKWVINYYTEKLIEYENTINIIEKKISDFRNLFIYIINKISKPVEEAIKLCPICFENEVDICLNPCGHTLCNKCVLSNRSRYTNDKCYSCRTTIQDYIKIFFSL